MAKAMVVAALALMLQGPGYSPVSPAAESPVCTVAGESPEPADPVLFPTTGQTFTLPPDANAACPDVPLPPVRPAAPDIFGTVALPVKSTALSWRWDQARRPIPSSGDAPWQDIVARAALLEDREKLALINNWVNNTIRFTEDRDRDHWASAEETFRHGAGDCEDFAIAKLSLLQDAGLSTDTLFLVIVRDTLRNIDHAVLAARIDGEMLVLDSRTERILPSSLIRDYRPIFSFGSEFAWTHGYAHSASSTPGQ